MALGRFESSRTASLSFLHRFLALKLGVEKIEGRPVETAWKQQFPWKMLVDLYNDSCRCCESLLEFLQLSLFLIDIYLLIPPLPAFVTTSCGSIFPIGIVNLGAELAVVACGNLEFQPRFRSTQFQVFEGFGCHGGAAEQLGCLDGGGFKDFFFCFFVYPVYFWEKWSTIFRLIFFRLKPPTTLVVCWNQIHPTAFPIETARMFLQRNCLAVMLRQRCSDGDSQFQWGMNGVHHVRTNRYHG